ncbi:MAG: glycosyltransferase family 4 protein [Syntrophales bacterium]|jgi:UDP-glucose:(heptosyl)LPS alpha-1,3-glucosyltransferase|nr:glycosyltransferase family 4 protein [Syntrophales bacterium]
MNRPCRIAVVIPKYGLVGGAEGSSAALTERVALDNPDFEIHVFANRWQQDAETTGRIFPHHIPIISFPRFLKTVSFAFFAERAIAKIGFDVVHAHDRIFRPDIYTLHGLPHRIWAKEVRKKRRLSLFDRTTAWVEKRMVNGGSCRYFLAVSHLTRDIFLKEYPVNPASAPVIHPGIDPATVAARGTDADRQAIRRKYGLPPTAPLIIFVSMNFDIKGLDSLLGGLGKLKQLYPEQPFHLLIVGKGNQRKYEQVAKQTGVSDHVTFTGVVSRKDLEYIYATGDLYAMLSKFDTFGMVVLEAMAKGLPVVISGNVGARDLVREGVNGFVIENTGDAESVAKVLYYALQKDVITPMSIAARQTALEYTWERSARQVADIYREIIAMKTREHLR